MRARERTAWGRQVTNASVMSASDGWTDDDDVAGVDDDDDGWGAGEDDGDATRVVGGRGGVDARSSDGWDDDEDADGSNLDASDEDAGEDDDGESSDGWGDEDDVVMVRGASARARAVTEEATTREEEEEEEEEEEDAAVVRERRFATLALDSPNASGTETESEDEEMFARPRVFLEMERRESAEAEKREALRARDVNAEPPSRDGGAGKTIVAGREHAARVDTAMEFDDVVDDDDVEEDDVDDWDEDTEEPRASSGARAGGGLSRMGLLPARNIAETHPWRTRLPHFVPVTELAPQSFHEGELVHVDYLAQFGGPRSAATRARPASASELVSDRAAKQSATRTVTPRWYTDERGIKTFVDARGVSRTGKAAYKASQKAFG